jgi:hypothetical protein
MARGTEVVAGDAFASVHARVVRVVDALLAGDADGVGLGLDLQVVLVDARQLHECQDVLALLKHIDGREGPAAGGHVLKPVAGESGFELPLQAQ